ncbi:MAG: 6-phosphogluconolactonase [Solirubrobacterales bacterium]|nr:6-phosphogluconolactonase [Solirubrobacterales bacterium]
MTLITRLPDQEAVALHAAQVVADVVNGTSSTVHVALAGGTTPERCHELLAPLVTDWGHVHLWLSDERAVPPDDDDSNFKMIRRSLLDRISIPAENVHRVLGELGPYAAADDYEREIREHVTAGIDGVPIIDIVMAGMGPDGHTCSLFPGHKELEIRDRLVVGLEDSPKPPPERITFTLPLLNAATRTLLLSAGEGKREATARVIAGPDPATPASMLALGNLELIVDRAAAPS